MTSRTCRRCAFAGAAVAVALGLVAVASLRAQDLPADIWIEAESSPSHTFNGPSGEQEFAGLVSGDRILRLWKGEDPGPDGYRAGFPFTIERGGTYHLWLAASTDGTSPFAWSVDGGTWGRPDEDLDADMTSAFGVSNCMRWIRLGDVSLTPGQHTLTVRVNERRTLLEHAYLLYLDALLITARPVQPDGLTRPEDLPKLKVVDTSAVVPVARAGKAGPPMLLGSSVGSTRQNRILVSLGFKLLQTDSDHLTVNEVAPGQWDWSSADAGLASARAAGAQWQYFPHFHWAPDWLMQTDRFVPSIGLASGRKLRCMSLWSPYLPEWFDHCYAAMAEHYGSGADQVAAIYLGVHGDFGEALYPLGFHPGERERFGEQGSGMADYWCGDPHARASFARAVQAHYQSLDRLNASWGAQLTRWEDLTYPAVPTKAPEDLSVAERRRWLDFINWYHDSLTDFTAMVARTARKHFPRSRLMLPVGNGDEALVGGCDLTALVKVCRESGVDMRSTHGGYLPVPQNLGSMLRRLASAAHFYGVTFWSEPPGNITLDGEVGRIFESISCRANGFWDWGSNPVAARRVFQRYHNFLTQEQIVCDVALLFPMTDHRLRPTVGYPPLLHAAGITLRSVMDFDLIDERMIADGALKAVRVLVIPDGTFFAPAALAQIEAWVRGGGVMVRGSQPMLTLEGDRTVWRRLSGVSDPSPTAAGGVVAKNTGFLRYTSRLSPPADSDGVTAVAPQAKVLATVADHPAVWANPVGTGWVVICAGGANNLPLFRSVIRDVVYNLPKLDPTQRGARELAPDAAWGNLYTVLLQSGEVIAYNHGDEPLTAIVSGHRVELAPHSIVSLSGQ